MAEKEAKARIKINKLLEEAGWRFFDNEQGKATIKLESSIRMDDLGEDFENSKNGFIDFLLVDENQNPVLVLEAKKESLNPLVGKEQARNYAKSQKVKFIILSNGTLHYLWNVESGNPEQIQVFPTLESIKQYYDFNPEPQKLIDEVVNDDYVVLTQLPNYKDIPEFKDGFKKKDLIFNLKLRFLRYYQVEAIKAVQKTVSEGKKRFLLEMATGTGKTLTSAAIIKLFYRTGNARRILFLVDRLELEEQARKDFTNYLKNDLTTVVYKEKRNDWRKAEIVVTTIQSLMVNNKYKKLFSPTDFDLIISDESHRLLGGGNSRALFEYFLGYKLGLTATPKDYLKNLDTDNIDDPRELERRMLLDTYTTFGCESGTPTYRYTLVDGAKDGYLRQPIVVDARTDVTTKLLSEQGYGVMVTVASTETEDVLEEVKYKQNHFERKFFSEETNRVLCKTFIENGLKDPITGEFGKGLVFAVSQNHAAKLTQLLNEYAHQFFPNKYQSDFAVQVTSNVQNAQQMTVDFSNDKLLGFSNFAKGNENLESYKTSKARVCVTVGMMTTGWDCPNILNLGLMRPIFSPTEFIQIKGRGTRIHKFEHKFKNELGEEEIISIDKQAFKLFDFFATCEYFEEKYEYDQVLKLPANIDTGDDLPITDDNTPKPKRSGYEFTDSDKILSFNEQQVDYSGMKVDRMFFQQFEEKIKTDDEIKQLMEAGDVEIATVRAKEKYDNKPEEYFDLEKLRKSLKIDRKIGWRELLELIYFGNKIKGKDDLLDDEFEKFISTNNVSDIADLQALRYFFYAYITDPSVREIIDQQDFTELYHNPTFNVDDFNRVDDEMKNKLPYYVKTYVPLNKFLSV
ncbi:MAG: DEAD/DEAH box helicase family protein [Chitinophagaceae bacterium]|nr:DEAD/DEAH box helicase family protein [Chitinophagaceae bacterium]MCW5927780.1 DEAD/DEAH box helicase family protein [Chitinophagaceae bacterium]